MIKDQTVLGNMSAQDNTSSDINQNRSDIKLVEIYAIIRLIHKSLLHRLTPKVLKYPTYFMPSIVNCPIHSC